MKESDDEVMARTTSGFAPSRSQEPADGRLSLPLQVRAAERAYLRGRRHAAADAGVEPDQPVVGLAFSGGGIRSATFCLGVLQALSKSGFLKHVDYLSTVSGGGYVGAALSSYLSHPAIEKASSDPTGASDYTAEQNGWTAESHDTWRGFANRFPFHREAALHHLRTHGNFLVLHRAFLSRDLMRVVGVVSTGVIMTVSMYVMAMLAVTLLMLGLVELFGGSTAWATLSGNQRSWAFVPPAWELMVLPSGVGVLFGVAGWLWSFRLGTSKRTAGEGETAEDASERRQLLLTAVAWIALAALIAARRFIAPGGPGLGIPTGEQGQWAIVFYNIGALVTVITLSTTILPRFRNAWDLRRRSRMGALSAMGLYAIAGVGFICVFPLLLNWARAWLATASFGLLGSASLTAWLARPHLPGSARARRVAKIARIAALKLVVPLTVIGTMVGIAVVLLDLLHLGAHDLLTWLSLAVCAVLFLGFVVDYNRVSPHYFYRDRIAEAYLRTEAKMTTGDDRTRSGLQLVRDDERIRMCELHGRLCGSGPPATKDPGERRARIAQMRTALERIEQLDKQQRHEGRNAALARDEAFKLCQEHWGIVENAAPYHLIVGALNLAGTRDLARRDRKSDHFVFSRLFCGSSTTGYELTDVYDDGNVELARAITISGAAAAPAAGMYSSRMQAFAATIFNLRLGYWTANPSRTKAPESSTRRARIGNSARIAFWPLYLCREMLGLTNASTRMVNLSDGGHTGDNVALVPLLQRRCELIIVCDASCDPKTTCDDLASAVRIAYVDENVVVKIDTTQLKPVEDGQRSGAHYAIGSIEYPKACTDDPEDPDKRSLRAIVLYIKAVLPAGEMPLAVRAYASTHEHFPHDTTGDQFFDDAQFEAYRQLGEALASRVIEDIAAADAQTRPVLASIRRRLGFAGEAELAPPSLAAGGAL